MLGEEPPIDGVEEEEDGEERGSSAHRGAWPGSGQAGGEQRDEGEEGWCAEETEEDDECLPGEGEEEEEESSCKERRPRDEGPALVCFCLCTCVRVRASEGQIEAVTKTYLCGTFLCEDFKRK